MKTIIKWSSIVVIATAIYFVMGIAIKMIIAGSSAGESIMIVIAVLAASNIYEAFGKIFCKPQNELDKRNL